MHAALRISRLFTFEERKKRGRPSVRHRGSCDLGIRVQSLSLLSSSCLYLVNLLEPRRKNVSVVQLLASVHRLLRCHASGRTQYCVRNQTPTREVKELARLDSDCLYLGETKFQYSIHKSHFRMFNFTSDSTHN